MVYVPMYSRRELEKLTKKYCKLTYIVIKTLFLLQNTHYDN